MTKGELVKALSGYPDDMPVVKVFWVHSENGRDMETVTNVSRATFEPLEPYKHSLTDVIALD